MNDQDYLEQSEVFCSADFFTDKVSPAELDRMFDAAEAATAWADRCKKALFYGKPYSPRSDHLMGTSLRHQPELKDVIHGILGLFTEAGELMEMLHAVLRGEKDLDFVNLLEEIGDLAWYEAVLHRSAGTTPAQARATNIAKLSRRYPDKAFTQQAAIDRDLHAERQILETLALNQKDAGK